MRRRSALPWLAFALLAAGCRQESLPADHRLPDGAVYQGDVRDHLFHGEGTLTWPDGRHYAGEFVDGLMHGQGRRMDAEGCVYEGAFVNGLPEGEGRYQCRGALYQGAFELGKLVQGRVEYPGAGVYQGSLRDWQPEGEGIWTGPDGDVYQGAFVDGEIANGSYRRDGEIVYRGEFQDWLFHGHGELWLPEGRRYRGQFEHGGIDGPGQRVVVGDNGEESIEQGFFIGGEFFSNPHGHDQRRRQRAEQVEARLYSEERRLQRALTALNPQEPGRRDIYVLLVGGDGRQAVFSREVRWVAERLGAHWEPRGHLLTLVNGETNGADGDAPLATRTSLRESLETLNAIADPDEDLVFVHLVSHGEESGDLVLEQPGLTLNDVSPADVAAWLDAMPPRYLWLVVSACYSGNWIEPLASRRRLVLTAAAADRTSFGCGDASERTWFSEALYGAALDSVGPDDPVAWFNAAQKAVTTMEAEQGIEADEQSQPRAHFGKAFLDWWRQP